MSNAWGGYAVRMASLDEEDCEPYICHLNAVLEGDGTRKLNTRSDSPPWHTGPSLEAYIHGRWQGHPPRSLHDKPTVIRVLQTWSHDFHTDGKQTEYTTGRRWLFFPPGQNIDILAFWGRKKKDLKSKTGQIGSDWNLGLWTRFNIQKRYGY